MSRTHFLIPLRVLPSRVLSFRVLSITVLSFGVASPLFAEEGHSVPEGTEHAPSTSDAAHKAGAESGAATEPSHATPAAATTHNTATHTAGTETHQGSSSAEAHENAEHSEGDAHGEEGESHAHHGHSHHLALFLGATLEEGNLFPSLGVDYAFRIPSGKRRLGLTAFVELTAAEELLLLAGAGLEYHPIEPVKLIAVAGLERGLSDGSEPIAEPLAIGAASGTAGFPGTATDATRATEAATSDAVSLIRLGVAYDFHVGNFSLTPSLFGDYVHEHFGAVIGLGFGGGF